MEIFTKVEDGKAEVEFKNDGEVLTLDFRLDSMGTMRFLESAIKAEKTKSEKRRVEAYINVMHRAIRMVGEETFEELEDFYYDAGEDLTLEVFIGSILSAFSDVDKLPKE